MQCLGLDLGTSGIRGVVLDGDDVIASEAVAIRPDRRRDPHALQAAILTVLGRLPLGQIGALAVAGTSGTLLGVGRGGHPVGTLSLYNDAADPAVLAALEAVAPAGSPARGYSSALARACVVAREPGVVRILHEADWIAGTFSGRFDTTDENNALKTGYDPVARRWPDWIGALGLAPNQLPEVLPPGEPVGPVCPSLARRIGLRLSAMVASGTTDGCASFLSAGARVPGDGATALGSTLTLKILSTRPICAPEFGVYSHRLWDNWLAGGASNAGGAVLAAHFDPAAITALSERIDPEHPTGLGYYPLLRPGERFPVNDLRTHPA